MDRSFDDLKKKFMNATPNDNVKYDKDGHIINWDDLHDDTKRWLEGKD